jgi:WXG100 family type VII secretion target
MIEGGEQGLSAIPADVKALGRYAAGVAQALRDALDSAANEVRDLLQDSWTGVAAEEFSRGWDEIRDGGQKIQVALVEMAEKLGANADALVATDSVAAGNFGDDEPFPEVTLDL